MAEIQRSGRLSQIAAQSAGRHGPRGFGSGSGLGAGAPCLPMLLISTAPFFVASELCLRPRVTPFMAQTRYRSVSATASTDTRAKRNRHLPVPASNSPALSFEGQAALRRRPIRPKTTQRRSEQQNACRKWHCS